MTKSAIHFGQASAAWADLSDEEFLSAIRWNRNARPALVRCAKQGDVAGFTTALQKSGCLLGSESRGRRIAKSLSGHPSLWSADPFDDGPRSSDLISICRTFGAKPKRPKGKKAAKSFRKAHASQAESRLEDWLQGTADHPVQPYECLILFELLPTVGSQLSRLLCWSLWRVALTVALQMPIDPVDETDGGIPDEERLLVCGELPLQAGLLFSGLKSAGRTRKSGAAFLSQELLESTDTDGMPMAELTERLPLWLAGFVRSALWGTAFKQSLWNADTERRLQNLVRASASLCRADGRLALSNGLAVPAVPILSAAVTATALKKKSPPTRLLADLESVSQNGRGKNGKKSSRGVCKRTKKASRIDKGKTYPGRQSDWSCLACLRTDWTPEAAVLVVAHDEPVLRLDLSVGNLSILEGEWPLDVSIDGDPLSLDNGWDCTCWFSDGDIDFIELQHVVGNGVVFDRQLLLSRKEQFACLIDCITGIPDQNLEYSSQLPMSSGIDMKADTHTRELRGRNSRHSVRCYPISLPCDRVQSAAGAFELTEGNPRLTQESAGGLVAPIVLDWSRGRRKLDADWNRLTVACDGKAVPACDAAGFRLRVGDLHLVIFRSLRNHGQPRTVLGMHTLHETAIGRFTPSGTVEPLLLVE